MKSDWIRLAEIEDAVESMWPIRLARALYIVSCLRREYDRGYSDACDDKDDDYFGDDDDGCIGADCCCPHLFHSRNECFTAEMAEAYEKELS